MSGWSKRLVLDISDRGPDVCLGQGKAVPKLCSSNPNCAAGIQLPGEDLAQP